MKDHAIAIGRLFLLATLLALLPAPVASQADSATVQVVRVIDGDTIQVCCFFGDRVKVRYIGIDTTCLGWRVDLRAGRRLPQVASGSLGEGGAVVGFAHGLGHQRDPLEDEVRSPRTRRGPEVVGAALELTTDRLPRCIVKPLAE